MPNEKKGLTVKIDAELHAKVKAYIEAHDMTMAEFVSRALEHELQPQQTGGMEKMRTLAVQIPEDLFQQIKDYLQRNSMTQKEFVIGLIREEINRDLAQQNTETENFEEELDEDEMEEEELDEDEADEEELDEDEAFDIAMQQ